MVAGPLAAAGSGSYGQTALPGANTANVTLQYSAVHALASPLTAVYSGDRNYQGCTSAPVTITLDSSPIVSAVGVALSAFQNIKVGTPISMNVIVAPQQFPPAGEPNDPIPTGTVQVTIDGAAVGSPLTIAPFSLGPSDSSANVNIDTSKKAVPGHAYSGRDLQWSGNYQASLLHDAALHAHCSGFLNHRKPGLSLRH